MVPVPSAPSREEFVILVFSASMFIAWTALERLAVRRPRRRLDVDADFFGGTSAHHHDGQVGTDGHGHGGSVGGDGGWGDAGGGGGHGGGH